MRIVVAADSLALPRPANIHTWRRGSGEELGVRTQDTYPWLLERALRAETPDADAHVINRGTRHQTMPGLVAEADDLVHFFEPDVLVVHVGIVDCWPRQELSGNPRVPLETYFKALVELLGHLGMHPQTLPVFVGICPTSQKMERRAPGAGANIARYNQVLARVAAEVGTPFVDMAAHVDPEDPDGHLLPDGSHLSRSGNALLARLLHDAVRVLESQR